jgi:hypothetical protein
MYPSRIATWHGMRPKDLFIQLMGGSPMPRYCEASAETCSITDGPPFSIVCLAAESAYLSPSHGTPVMYINLEDHLTYYTKKTNSAFQKVLTLLRSPICGNARLHWGKAGWPQHAQCFDGAEEYPASWCHFGCAVQQFDPKGKFAGVGGDQVWQWRAEAIASGQEVDFRRCCSATGFDYGRCKCSKRRPGSCKA